MKSERNRKNAFVYVFQTVLNGHPLGNGWRPLKGGWTLDRGEKNNKKALSQSGLRLLAA